MYIPAYHCITYANIVSNTAISLAAVHVVALMQKNMHLDIHLETFGPICLPYIEAVTPVFVMFIVGQFFMFIQNEVRKTLENAPGGMNISS